MTGFLDLKQLGEYTGLSVKTLRRYLRLGMPAYQISGKILVPLAGFHSWLEGFAMHKKRDIDQTVNEVMKEYISSR